MGYRTLLTGLLMVGTSSGAFAQLTAFGDGKPQERSLVRVFYWDQGKNLSPGQIALHYGRPEWKAEYDDPAKFDEMTRGKTVRLGKDYWTTLDTTVPLKIGDRTVQPGEYFLGAARSVDGKSWDLLFLDAAKCRAEKIDAFQTETAPVLFKVPLTLTQQQDVEKRLMMQISRNEKDPTQLTLMINWGKMKLTTAITAVVATT